MTPIIRIAFVSACLVAQSVFFIPKGLSLGMRDMQTPAHRASDAMDSPLVPERESLADKIRVIELQCVTDGRLFRMAFGKETLKKKAQIDVRGYVYGILVFCAEDMTVRLDGRHLNRIRKNEDGSFSLVHVGKLSPERISFPSADRGYYENISPGEREKRGSPVFVPGGYSFFPEITGDLIVPKSEFQVVLESEGKRLELTVRQQGYRAVRRIPSVPSAPGNGITFRYLGTRLRDFEANTKDLEAKLDAVVAGIESVEKNFGLDLVDTVNILDYEDAYNAVTCEGANQIWFYAAVLPKESPEELESMAAHEALHVYVSRKKLSADWDVRELFADFKGYDEFSYARFMLTTVGYVPSQTTQAPCVSPVFFDFINEKNVLKGTTGGHSGENVDEFCASFLHFLMYMDRFKTNLDRVISLSGNRRSRLLTPHEKAEIVADCIKTIEVVGKALPEEEADPKHTDASRPFLKGALEKAREIRVRAMNPVPEGPCPSEPKTMGDVQERRRTAIAPHSLASD